MSTYIGADSNSYYNYHAVITYFNTIIHMKSSAAVCQQANSGNHLVIKKEIQYSCYPTPIREIFALGIHACIHCTQVWLI